MAVFSAAAIPTTHPPNSPKAVKRRDTSGDSLPQPTQGLWRTTTDRARLPTTRNPQSLSLEPQQRHRGPDKLAAKLFRVDSIHGGANSLSIFLPCATDSGAAA